MYITFKSMEMLSVNNQHYGGDYQDNYKQPLEYLSPFLCRKPPLLHPLLLRPVSAVMMMVMVVVSRVTVMMPFRMAVVAMMCAVLCCSHLFLVILMVVVFPMLKAAPPLRARQCVPPQHLLLQDRNAW